MAYMDAHRLEIWFFTALLSITILLSWLVLAPYVGALVLAGTLAFLFQPLYQKLLRVFRNESVTSFATVIIITLIVFIPVGYFAVKIFWEATALYTSLTSNGGFDFGKAITNFLSLHFKNLGTPGIVLNTNDYIRQALSWFINNLGSFFSGVTQVFFTTFLSLLGLFYFLKDGDRIKQWLLEIIPLSPKHTEGILIEMENVGSSVIKGTLMVAIIQGLVMGAGFFLFNIPNPVFWAALVVPASIIPIVGTWLVVIPAIAYLFLTGQTFLGIGLLVWSVVLVNIVYNIISPQLMHRGVHIHPYLILLAVLGGISLFGPIGFLVGPLVMSLLLSLLKIYRKLIVRYE